MNELLSLTLSIITGIYTLESSNGKYDSCKNKGMVNGFGYASNRVCFKNYAEAEAKVAGWVKDEILRGSTTNQLLCRYQGGKRLDDCPYAKKWRSLKIHI